MKLCHWNSNSPVTLHCFQMDKQILWCRFSPKKCLIVYSSRLPHHKQKASGRVTLWIFNSIYKRSLKNEIKWRKFIDYCNQLFNYSLWNTLSNPAIKSIRSHCISSLSSLFPHSQDSAHQLHALIWFLLTFPSVLCQKFNIISCGIFHINTGENSTSALVAAEAWQGQRQ